LAERFVTYRTRKADDSADLKIYFLEEADLYRFLESEGHPVLAAEFRAELRAIDIETERNVSFIAYAIWYYKKELSGLVPPEGGGGPDPALLAALEDALAAYQIVVDARKARDARIAHLQQTAGQGGVKGNIAKSELDQMFADDQTARNKAEITAAAKRRLAQKAVDSGSDGAAARERALLLEMKKVEAEKKKERRPGKTRTRRKTK